MSSGRDAQSVFDLVNSEVSEFNFMEKLVPQTCDGAAVMYMLFVFPAKSPLVPQLRGNDSSTIVNSLLT